MMFYLYLYAATAVIVIAIQVINRRLKPKPVEDAGVQIGSYFYYKGFAVRKAHNVEIDEDGNYWIDGRKYTQQQLDNWHKKLTEVS